jgi:ketosteroid isomerase-like protein
VTSAELELVRTIFAAWERGDFGSVAWADPGIEFVMADGPAPGSWTGLEGMAKAGRETLNAWEDARVVVDEYRQLDDERMLVLVRRSGRGKSSGLAVDQLLGTQGAILTHVRAGAVTRLVFYWDRERAFASLGLAPPPPERAR